MCFIQKLFVRSHLRHDDDNVKLRDVKGFIFYKVGRRCSFHTGIREKLGEMVGVYLMAAIKYLFFVV